MAGTAAHAQLTLNRPDNGLRIIAAVTPALVGDARRDQDRLVRLAIPWSGSNGGDDTPIEDHPF
jgi:hypothetical protein